MEQTNTSQPLLLNSLAAWLSRLFQENKIPFLSAMLFGLLAHGYDFANKLVNHDEVGQLFLKGETVTSGRWGLGAMDLIFPNISMPWIYGLITIFLISVSIAIIVRVFRIQNPVLQVLLSASIIVFPSLTGTFGFMFTATSYGVSFLLACMALWFIQKDGIRWALPALVCMIGSMSIYQAYISITASLLVLLLIQKLLHDDDAAAVFRRGVYYLSFLVISLVAYFVASKLVLLLKHTGFNSYAEEAMSGDMPGIVQRIVLAYRHFVLSFTQSYNGLIPTPFSRTLHYLMLVVSGVLLAVWFLRERKSNLLRFALLLALLAVLPLAINCMYLVIQANRIHTLVLYGFFAFYVLLTVLCEEMLPSHMEQKLPELLRRSAVNAIGLLITLNVIGNIYVANACYLNMYLAYENAYAFYSSVITELRTNPEFTEDTKLAVVGSMPMQPYRENNFSFTFGLHGIYGFYPDTYTKKQFVEFYLGMNLPFVSDQEAQEIRQSEAFREMPCYPYYGSTQMIDGVMVVKLSD